MNVQDYISSGIIEIYVLGLASAEERSEFEQMCQQHPEILQARINFEIALEKQAMQNAIIPPPALKQQIIQEISSTGKLKTINETPVRNISWLKYAAVACLVLLMGSLYWNISLFNKNKQLQKEYESGLVKMDDMKGDMKMIMQNPNIKMAAMKGMPEAPGAAATVYWDTTSRDAYLLINNLPAPPSAKQYQLWALLNGKHIDLGMIDNNFFVKQNRLLLKTKNVQNAQAFAITLEDMGGHPEPKGKMYVMGNL